MKKIQILLGIAILGLLTSCLKDQEDIFDKPSAQRAEEAIAAAPGCQLKDDPSTLTYPMPLETAGKDDVYVGRIRKDLSDDCGLTFWLSGDQIRKGAALNAVQIAEYLVKVGNVK